MDSIYKDFKKYSQYDLNQDMSGAHSIVGMTPNILEERDMHVTQMDVFSRLMMDRIIFLGMPIDDQVANVVQAQLLFMQKSSNEPINMYINSPGGNVYAGYGIYDTMNLVKPEVATTCTGIAASMAAVLLSAGEKGKRSALSHSRVMIHQPLGGVQGQASDIQITAEEIAKVKDEIYNILTKTTGQDYDKIKDDSDRDYWLRGEEAVEYGMVDEIIKNDDQ